jgi:hypothetical protein
VLPQVRLLLHHERPAVREAAVLVVGAMGSPKEDGDGVRSLLSDSQVPVRAAALVAVRQLGDVDAFDAVAEFLLDPDSGIRLKAIVTLSELSQKGSLGSKLAETFAKYLSQASDQARMDLIVESAKLGAKELGPVLSKLTSDNDPMIRSHAIMGLTKINSPEYGPRILELLAIEREYWPRIQLAGAVQVMRLDAGIDRLIEWLSDQDSNIRSASLRALRALSQMNFGGERANWEEWRAKTRRQ